MACCNYVPTVEGGGGGGGGGGGTVREGRQGLLQPTEKIGGILWRPCVP